MTVGAAWERYLRDPATSHRPEGDAARLARLEDRVAIEEHIYRWTYYHDAKMLDEKIALHHPDCLIHHRAGDLRGAEAIRAFFLVGPPNSHVRDMRHHVTNLTMWFANDDEVETLALYTWNQDMLDFESGEWTAAIGGGWYADRLIRTEDGWRYIERDFVRTYDFRLDGNTSFSQPMIGLEAVTAADAERLRSSSILADRGEA